MAETKKAVPSGGAGDRNGGMRIDPALVRELAQMLTDNALSEIEVADGDRRIKVARELFASASAASAPSPAASSAAASLAPQETAGEDISGAMIKSPMVGTAFLSPEPSANPFVQVGDTVKAGDTLLIIEAMKVMNSITAPEGGVIKKIMVSDAQPVEFDQPLVIVG